MAHCSRCRKFMLFPSQTGYCNDCYAFTVNQENERRRKEQEQKRLEEEARRKKEERESQMHYAHMFSSGPSDSEFSKYDTQVGLTREEENLFRTYAKDDILRDEPPFEEIYGIIFEEIIKDIIRTSKYVGEPLDESTVRGLFKNGWEIRFDRRLLDRKAEKNGSAAFTMDNTDAFLQLAAERVSMPSSPNTWFFCDVCDYEWKAYYISGKSPRPVCPHCGNDFGVCEIIK